MFPNYTPKETVLDSLRHSTLSFYLTGSRYFGGATDGSDWDFFCQHSEEVRNFLCSIGFYPLSEDAYSGDMNIVEIYRYSSSEITVDVQMQKDLLKKKRAQDRIKKMGISPKSFPEKWMRKTLWNLAYQD